MARKAFEIWECRKAKKLKWTDKVGNGDVLNKVKQTICYTVLKRKESCIRHAVRRRYMLITVLEYTLAEWEGEGRA